MKKHKKAIIIGAAVIVVATAVAIAVVASSPAAASAAAGTAGATSGTDLASSRSVSPETKGAESQEESKPIPSDCTGDRPSVGAGQAPIMAEVLDDHITGLKCIVAGSTDGQLVESSQPSCQISFGESVRELGSSIAHQAFDELSHLLQLIPRLCEEVKALGAKVFPGDFLDNNRQYAGTPADNYEKLVTGGHEAIDMVFSTHQAEYFIEESQYGDLERKIAIGVLPPPNAIFKTCTDPKRFVDAGKVLDRAGYTKAGRGLLKQGYRQGSVFPKPLGNPAQINAGGQRALESILEHPERVFYERPHPIHGTVIEFVIPNECGVRFTIEGEMIGFLEP